MRWFAALLCLLWLPFGSAETLRIGMEDVNNRPFEFFDASAKLTGFHVELVRAVCKSLGWKPEFRRLPWQRALHAVETDEVSALLFVAKSPERAHFAEFLPDNLLHISHTALYIRRARANEIHFAEPLEQFVKRWHTAAPAGYLMSDKVAELISQGAPIAQPKVTQAQLFIMLMSGQYDAIFGSASAQEVAREDIRTLDREVKRLPDSLIAGKGMYIAFSRKADPKLGREFAAAYRAFRQTAEYRDLAHHFGVTELLPNAEDFN